MCVFLPPIINPAHFYCVGVNYADHLKEVQEAGVPRPRPKQPSLFIRFPETLVGHRRSMVIPKVSDQFDYEAELAVIIGTGGRYIDDRTAVAKRPARRTAQQGVPRTSRLRCRE
jgi:2-keto-4-pentenoate hydratase/2-oxohepta-3-ene-1,7-dioic acid hydratase in catechol pathway